MYRYDEVWQPLYNESGAVKYLHTRTVYDKSGQKQYEDVRKEPVTYNTGATIPYHRTHYIYYLDGKLKQVFDYIGRKTEYAYDADGNVTGEKVYTNSSEYNRTGYQYNYLGKPYSQTKYVDKKDLDGFSSTDSGEKGITTFYEEYDKNGNLKKLRKPVGSAVENGSLVVDYTDITYSYDKLNRQTGMVYTALDENGVQQIVDRITEYTWDEKPLKQYDEADNLTQYFYTTLGNLEKVKNAKQEVYGKSMNPSPTITLAREFFKKCHFSICISAGLPL